jgi:HPt (histidine-containing phosphotransfer) domain-containing protein
MPVPRKSERLTVSSDHENEPDYETIDAEVEAVFVQVRNEYARALPKKLAELEDAIESARKEPDRADLYSEALNEAHRMKGTLGSYAFPELADLVTSVEKLLRQNNSDQSRWERINPQLTAILSEANTKAKKLSESAVKD